MPIFKVSSDLEKLAREVLRIQITVLGDCPQCGGSEYISGVCEDCGYIAPEVLEAIQEWQISQGMESQQQNKVASREVVEALSQIIVMAREKKKKDDKCPRCNGNMEHGINCRSCGFERPPGELDHTSPEFTGPSPEILKNIRRKFIPSSSALEKINEQKKKNKSKKKKKTSYRNNNVNRSSSNSNSVGTTPPPGEDLSDLGSVRGDDSTQVRKWVGDMALIDYELAHDPRQQGAGQ